MANALMILGLLGLIAGILAPIFRVLNKKSRRSRGWILFFMLSFFTFILGVVLGMQ